MPQCSACVYGDLSVLTLASPVNSLPIGGMIFFAITKINSNANGCISHTTNYITFGVLLALGIAGILVLFFIQKSSQTAVSSDKAGVNNDDDETIATNPLLVGSREHDIVKETRTHAAINALANAVKLLFTFNMGCLCFTFIYTGYELNFWSGVFGTMIGNMKAFNTYNIGIAAVFVGIGEMVAGALFGILVKFTNRFGRDVVVLLGMLIHFATFLLIFFNMPDSAIINDKGDNKGYLFSPSNIYLVHLCAFLLGFGDSIFNTQVYSLIGVLYPTDDLSAPAIALFKFFQSLTAAVGFLTSSFLVLKWQLLILTVLATTGTLSFAVVEWKHNRMSHNRMSRMSAHN